jgi:hypothetical protein
MVDHGSRRKSQFTGRVTSSGTVQEKDHHDVSLLTRVLGVSRQGYYAWTKRGMCARARHTIHLDQNRGRITRQDHT